MMKTNQHHHHQNRQFHWVLLAAVGYILVTTTTTTKSSWFSASSHVHSDTIFVSAFVIPSLSSSRRTTSSRFASSRPEWSVEDEEGVDDGKNDHLDNKRGESNSREFMIINDPAEITTNNNYDMHDVQHGSHLQRHDNNYRPQHAGRRQQQQNQQQQQQHTEFGALRPGTVVKIQVGDISLARKAWKKRRRSGSPLLVPCSVLDVDRRSMVRWNILYLLEKFGEPNSSSSSANARKGIELSAQKLARHYRYHLRSPLQRQADALGYDTKHDMLMDLLNPKIQETYGFSFVERQLEEPQQNTKPNKNKYNKNNDEGNGTMMFLEAPISSRSGRKRTNNTPLLQFQFGQTSENNVDETVTHTGFVRALKPPSNDDDNGNDDDNVDTTNRAVSKKSRREYTFLPLSAALRVSQKDELESSSLEQGQILTAVVFDYAEIGDGGSPLLTLSLNPGSVREALKFKQPVDRRNRHEVAGIRNDNNSNQNQPSPTIMIDDLKVGDGPYRAKVIDFRKGRALVDFGVGIDQGRTETSRVYGDLYFRDAMVPIAQDEDKELSKESGLDGSPFAGFSVEEIDGYDDDEDLEDVISASIADLDSFDDDDDDEIDDDSDVSDEDSSSTLADDLLALRSQDSFEEGTFEDGEEEEDISHLFQMDENGNLLYNDPDEDAAVIVEEGSDVATELRDEMGTEADRDDEDDISDEAMAQLFTENSDGSMMYHDPETGETMKVDKSDATFEDLKAMQALIDETMSSLSPSTQDATNGSNRQPSEHLPKQRYTSKHLEKNDVLDVYILSVSKHSKQIKVSTNPLVKGRDAKDLSQEDHARRKKDRLTKKLGGNLKQIYMLKGKEINGVVKATSEKWVYVQPESETRLPVGIATREEDMSAIAAGDHVKIEVAGLDEQRGQLSLKIKN